MILGLGADFVEIGRIGRYVTSTSEWGLAVVFSAWERERLAAGAEFAAGRFAVKEALLKALGIGFTRGLARLAEIETRHGPSGSPTVVTTGRVQMELKARGVENVLVTIAHDRGNALAVVVLTGAPAGAER